MEKLLIPETARISWNTIEDTIVQRDNQESIFLATFDDVASNTQHKHQIDYSYYNSGKYESAPKFLLHVYSFGIDSENYEDTINHFDKEYNTLDGANLDINYWLNFFKANERIITDKELNKNYWANRYENKNTGWDIGYPSEPIKKYIDQLTDKSIRILIPGAGNAYEAEYLIQLGFTNIDIMDISCIPIQNFLSRNPKFPKDQLLEVDFFEYSDQYDLIIEQTFFCSFVPTKENRNNYAKKMYDLLKPNGKLVGVWFDIPLIEGNMDKRPFGGSKEEYLKYLTAHFEVKIFETCYDSITPRAGQELFGIFIKK
jgi:methyl halide transferase